jgi:hypothetical protein
MDGYLADLNISLNQGWNKKKIEIHTVYWIEFFVPWTMSFPSQEHFDCFLDRDTSPGSIFVLVGHCDCEINKLWLCWNSQYQRWLKIKLTLFILESSVSSKLFSLKIRFGSCLIDPVLQQEETWTKLTLFILESSISSKLFSGEDVQ